MVGESAVGHLIAPGPALSHSEFSWEYRATPDAAVLTPTGVPETARVLVRATKSFDDTNARNSWPCVAASASTLVLTSGGGSIRIWDSATGALVRRLDGLPDLTAPGALTPDGTTAALALWSGEILLLDTVTGAVRTVSGDGGWARAFAFAPDGSYVVVVGEEGSAVIRDVRTGAVRHRLSGHVEAVLACAVAADGSYVVTASFDQTARIWDPGTGQVRHVLGGHDRPGHYRSVNACAIAPDGSFVVTAGREGTAILWDAATGELRHALPDLSPERRPELSGCAVAPDGSFVVTHDEHRQTKIWDTATGQLRHTLVGTDARLGPDGSYVVTVTAAPDTARIWDPATGALLHILVDSAGVESCGVVATGSQVLTLGRHTIRAWSVSTGQVDAPAVPSWLRPGQLDTSPEAVRYPLPAALTALGQRVIAEHSDPVRGCAIAPDGSFVVTIAGPTARIWDSPSGRLRHVLNGHSARLTACAITPDGSIVVTRSEDGATRTWASATGAARHTIGTPSPVGASGPPTLLAPDGSFLLAVGDVDEGGALTLWDTNTGAPRHTLAGHRKSVENAVMTPDGAFVLTGDGQTVRVWDAGSGTLLRTLGAPHEPTAVRAVAPDGSFVVTSAESGTRIWDHRTGELLRTLAEPAATVCVIAPDRSSMVSIDDRGTGRLWDLRTGALRTVLDAGTLNEDELRDSFRTAAMAATGSFVVTASWAGHLRFWDPRSGELRHHLAAHGGEIRSCAIAADASVLVTAGEDGTARVWHLPPVEAWPAPAPAPAVTIPSRAAVVDGLAAVGVDEQWLVTRTAGRLRVWDGATGALLRTIPTTYGPTHRPLAACREWVAGVRPDPRWEDRPTDDGPVEYRGGFDVDLWDVASGELRQTIAHPMSTVDDSAAGPPEPTVVADPHGRYVATAGQSGAALVWELDTGTSHPASPADNPVNAMAFDATGGELGIISSADNWLMVVDSATSSHRRRMFISPYVDHLVVGPGGAWAAAADLAAVADCDLAVFDVAAGEEILGRYDGGERGMAVGAPFATALGPVIGTDRGTIDLLDPRTAEPLRSLSWEPGLDDAAVAVGAVSPDGTLVAGSTDGHVAVWDVVTGDLVRSFPTEPVGDVLDDDPELLTFASAGRWLARAAGNRFWVWDIQTGELLCGPINPAP